MAKASKLPGMVRDCFKTIVRDLESKGELVGEGFLIEPKTLNGEPVMALNAGRFQNIAGLKANADQVDANLKIILEALPHAPDNFERCGKPTVLYRRRSLSWSDSDGNPTEWFNTFRNTWNETEGSATETSEYLGSNEWGESYMTPQQVMAKIREFRRDESLKDSFIAPKDEVLNKIDEATAKSIAESLFD